MRCWSTYDHTMPLRCGNLYCRRILEPPFEGVSLTGTTEHGQPCTIEMLLCVRCLARAWNQTVDLLIDEVSP